MLAPRYGSSRVSLFEAAVVTRNSWPPTLTNVFAATAFVPDVRSVLVYRCLEPYWRTWMRPRFWVANARQGQFTSRYTQNL